MKTFKLVTAARLLTMKYLLLITTLTTSLMFSAGSWAEWTEVVEGAAGDKYYVDLDRMREHGGYVYYWTLQDYIKPDKYGDYSDMFHKEGDCKRLRARALSLTSYKQPMGGGKGEDNTSSSTAAGDSTWKYPRPGTVAEALLEAVCAH